MGYRVYKLPYEHSSKLMKKELDKYGFPAQYGAIVIDPTGQAIEVNGFISNVRIQRLAPVANPQWCQSTCSGYMMQGFVDPSHVYVDTEIDDDGYIDMVQDENVPSTVFIVLIVVGSTGFVSCILCIVYYFYCRKKRYNEISKHDENSPLLSDDSNALLRVS